MSAIGSDAIHFEGWLARRDPQSGQWTLLVHAYCADGASFMMPMPEAVRQGTCSACSDVIPDHVHECLKALLDPP